MKPKNTKIIILTGIIFTLLFILTLQKGPSITGYVATEHAIKNIDAVLIDNKELNLVVDEDGTCVNKDIEIKSILASGKIIGNGKVEIKLITGNAELIVYSNNLQVKKEKQNLITGFHSSDKTQFETKEESGICLTPESDSDILKNIEEHLLDHNHYSKEILDYIKNINNNADRKQAFEDFKTNMPGTEFNNACEETCLMSGKLSKSPKLKFEVEHGTVLLLEKITYSVFNE